MTNNKKKRCLICDAKLEEDEDICHVCGCYQDEPCYDIEDDLGVVTVGMRIGIELIIKTSTR